jgi:hypothetical protein
MFRPLYSEKNRPGYPLQKRLGGHQNHSGTFEKDTNALALSRIEHCSSVVRTVVYYLYRQSHPGSKYKYMNAVRLFFPNYNNTLCGIFYDDVNVQFYRAVGKILGD